MTAPDLAELERTETVDHLDAVHGAQRSLSLWLIMLASSALFVAGLTWPALSTRVGVTALDGVVSVVPFLCAIAVAGVVYHAVGVRSPWYVLSDKLEGFVGSWAVAHLIRASNNAVSFFWFFHMVQVLMTSSAGVSWVYGLTVVSGPLYLTISFALSGDAGGAWLSALAGLLGLAVYLNCGKVYAELERSRRREADLRRAVALLRVEQERARIARDLHDSVATELTAMVWKTRELAAQVPEHARTGFGNLEERLRGAIAQLRAVVQSLRGDALTLAECSALLEQRCRELAGEATWSFSTYGEGADDEVEGFRLAVLPVCFELVRNAAAHAGARSIELAIEWRDVLVVRVRDDGAGLDRATLLESRGGLSSARERIARRGGTFDLVSSSPGTELVIRLPRPSR